MSANRMAWWPGYLQLWNRGELYSLVVALLYASLLNIALVATLVWHEWLPVWTVRSLWFLLFVASAWSWLGAFFSSAHRTKGPSSEECDQLLRDSQRDYLRGDYLEAEAGLHRILSSGREDMEAALLLASILRRTDRHRQAADCLDRLERFERARLWTAEIAQERQRLATSDQQNS